MRDELIGREDGAAVARRALAALARGRAGGVLFLGEAGIGKTRMLAELALLARRAKLPVVAGRASEFETDLPLGIVAAALEDRITRNRKAILAALGPERVALLAPALSALDPTGAALAELPAPGSVARARVHAAARALLEVLAGEAGLVVVLDDLQWADGASVDLLAHFLRRPPKRVLFALAAREHSLPGAVAQAIERATRDRAGIAAVVELGPLDAEQARRLIGADVDGASAERWIAESGGNPFYLQSLARAGDRGARVSAGDLPGAVRAALSAELEALDDDTVAVARAAAIVGDPVSRVLVAVAAGRAGGDVDGALDALLAADLLREGPVADELRFRHPIVRRAIADGVAHAERLTAHARLIEHLRSSGAPITAIAHHVAAAATAPDPAGAGTLAEAGHVVAAVAPQVAAEWFGVASRLLPNGPAHDLMRLALAARRAMCLGAAGELRESREVLRDVVGRLPQDGSRERGEAVAFSCAIDTLLGQRPAAMALLEREIADLVADDAPAAPVLHLQHAGLCVYAARFPDAAASAERALSGARRLEEAPLGAQAQALVAMAQYCNDDLRAAAAAAEAAADLVDRLPDHELAKRLESIGWLGWTEYFIGRHDAACAHFARGCAVATGAGQEYVLVGILVGWALTLMAMGRLAESDPIREHAFETAASGGLAWVLGAEAQAQLLRGDVAAALSAAERGAELLGPDHDGVSVLVQGVRAEALLESGKPEQAREMMLAAAGGPGMPNIETSYRPRWLEILVRAELALGRCEQAETWTQAAEEAARAGGLPLRLAEAGRCRAAVEHATGRFDAAAQHALAAAYAAHHAGAPLEEAKGRLLAGRALAAAGHSEAGLQALTAAHRIASDGGAGRMADDAALELRRLGQRVARGPRPPVSSAVVAAAPPTGALATLSPREREVASLISAGATNAAIAEQLHLSRRTVETHVRNIFEKLGVSSRAAIAAQYVQEHAATANKA